MAKRKYSTTEANFLALLDLTVDPVVVIDKTGKLLAANNGISEVLGVQHNNLAQKNFREMRFLDRETKSILLKKLNRRLSGLKVPTYEIKITTPRGKPKYFEVRGKLIKYCDEDADLVTFHDVTERKKLQEHLKATLNHKTKNLRESEEKYRLLVDSVREGIVALDPNHRIVFVNSRMAEILGFAEIEIVGKSLFCFVPERGFAHAMHYLDYCKEGIGGEFEFELVGKDGKPISALISTSAFKDDECKYVGTLALVSDITVRKNMEEKLTQERDMLEAVTANIGAGLTLIDKSYRILWANKTLRDNVDVKLDAPCYTVYNNLDTICPNCGVLKVFEEGSLTDVHEYSTLDKEGNPAFIELIATPIKDNIGNVIAALELAVPITKRKQVEQALKDSEERFRAISNSALDAIILVNDEGRIDYWNPAAERIFGYTAEETVGKETLNFIVPNRFHDKMSKGLVKFKKEGMGELLGKTTETIGIKRDGSEIPVAISTAKIQICGKNYAVGIVRDITEQKLTKQRLSEYSKHLKSMVEIRTVQLKDANDRLLKSERLAAIGELAGMIGHDLRNPLAGMRGATYFLKTKYGPKMDENGQKMLKTIDECITHSDKIINDLLDYSREIRLELIETTPQEAINKAFSHIEIPENITIVNTSADSPKIKVDMEKMLRVFINLIKNAFDAMPKGGNLSIKSEQSKNKVVFTFEDTGSGMTKETLHKLWTPLYTTKAKGMGFGLSICKRIVEAHSGTICVESSTEKGTTMTISIPINPKPTTEGEETWVVNQKLLSLTTPQQQKETVKPC
jgi:two-component system sensor kinase FixL